MEEMLFEVFIYIYISGALATILCTEAEQFVQFL